MFITADGQQQEKQTKQIKVLHSDSALSVSSDVLDSETIVLGFEDVLIVEMD